MSDEQPVTSPRRSLRDLLMARADGEDVSEDEIRIFRCEEDLVRSAIAYPRAIDQCGVRSAMLEASDYRATWEAIARATALHVGDGPLPSSTILAELRRTGEIRFASPGGNLWLHYVLSQPPAELNYSLQVLVPEVLQRHQLKTFTARLTKLSEQIPTTHDMRGLYSSYITECMRISTSPDGGRLGQSTVQIARMLRAGSQMIPTGIDPLDKHMGGGILRGSMIVVGAGTHAGKSYLAQRFARSQARINRESLYVSTEDPVDLFTCRHIADYSSGRLTPISILKRLLSQGKPFVLQGAADPLLVASCIDDMEKEQGHRARTYETKKGTASDVCAAIRRYRYIYGVDLVVVDYLQAITADEPTGNKTLDVAAIVTQLKKCAGDCGIVLVLLSQLARDDYRDGAEPSLNGFKYAGDIENEAEVGMLLWRDESDVLHCKIPKIKWVKAHNLRFIIPTDPVSGCFLDWEDDFTQPPPPPARGGGGGGQRGAPRTGYAPRSGGGGGRTRGPIPPPWPSAP